MFLKIRDVGIFRHKNPLVQSSSGIIIDEELLFQEELLK